MDGFEQKLCNLFSCNDIPKFKFTCPTNIISVKDCKDSCLLLFHAKTFTGF